MSLRFRHTTRLGLVFITLFAFAIRVYALDAQSLWYDEGVTAEVAKRGIAELTRWTAGDIQPPFYYYVVAVWGQIAGWSEWSLRFPSVIFGTLLPPLLAAVATGLTQRRRTGLLAALLGATHPLLVYYSQEARMYAMLTTLGVLLGYLVIHGETKIRRKWLHWTAYVIAATIAIYTHYFAFFLLIALTIAFLTDQLFLLPRTNRNVDAIPQSGPESAQTEPPARQSTAEVDNGDRTATIAVRGPILDFIVANIIVLVLYIPWFATLISRLSVDSSYWLGSLKVLEALRHVAISFVSGETVLEKEATRLLIPYGALTLFLLLVLLWKFQEHKRTILYSVLWVGFPVAAVLTLASIVPKFNARYVMIALPGLLLIWSIGITALMRVRKPTEPHTGHPLTLVRFRHIASALVAGLLLSGFVYADINWFMDPAFTKAEWRELSNYVRERIMAKQPGDPSAQLSKQASTDQSDDELIILVSGHAWPVWNYYAPDLPPLRLPEIEILDVNAVVDFASSAPSLRAALQGKANAWLIEWQQDVVDPMSIVPLQLGIAGEEEELDTQFWQLKLHHYTNIDTDSVLTGPTALNDSTTNFGNLLYLLDYTVTDQGALLLFWAADPEAEGEIPDLNLTGSVFTAEGLPFTQLTDRRPASYEYPTFRWQSDQVTVGHIPAQEWAGPGALPGQYRMRLGLYDVNGDLTGLDVIGPQNQPLGKHITLDLELPVPTEGPDYVDEVTFAELIPDLFVELLLSGEQAEPGQLVAMELHWYAEENPPDDYELQILWRLRSTDEVVGEQILRLSRQLETSQWPDDELLRTLFELRPPLNLPADDYWLEVGLTAPESRYIRVPFRVLGSTRIFAPPSYATKIDTTLGEQLHLLGVIEPIQTQPKAGEQVVLTLVWQAIEQMPADYTVTIQWLDENSRPAAQSDILLPGGSANWLPDQVELQTIIAPAPPEPGNYRLVTAVYDANQPDLPRLLTDEGLDLIELGNVTVTP